MYVVIAGCGRVGATLAGWLADDGHDVTVIDRDQAALDRLGKAFNGATLRGEAFDVDVLREAGVDKADVFCAVTDSDNANLMAVEVATRVFSTRRAIARLYDPAREPAYRALGIRHVTGTRLLANVFYEQVLDEEFQYHVAFTDGDVEIVEFHLGEQAKGMTVGAFEIRNKLRVAAVRRGDHTYIPGRRFQLEPDDLVVAAARTGVKTRISHLLK
jgi:trk system potassium uptake protein TrkA